MKKKAVVKKQEPIVFFDSSRIVTDSLLIAGEFEKPHKMVLRKIDNAVERDKRLKIGGRIFALSSYKTSQNKTQKKYLLNRDAFLEIAMTFTGDRAAQLRDRFIKAFNHLEASYCKHQSDTARIEARQKGKVIRLQETDVVKEFVEYATAQGSQNARRYYCNLTKMENSALFFLSQKFDNIRNFLNIEQLFNISTADSVVKKALRDGMFGNLCYREIYILAKQRVETLVSVIGKIQVPQFQIESLQSKQLQLFQVTA